MKNQEKSDLTGINVEKEISKQANEVKKDEEVKVDIVKDYENTLKRLQADFENYIKRTEKEKEDFVKYSAARTLQKFLTIIDDLDRAMLLLEKSQNEDIKTGIQLVHKQFHKILEEEGVKPMQCKGKMFDPYCHEIIDMVEHETPEGTVVEELQKGYHIHDKVLRTAKVRVSKGSKK